MPEQDATGLASMMEDGRQDEIRKLQPSLFIGLGGTGLEVVLRIRRRILHATWGPGRSVRVSSLEEFPVAEFMHFDLDQGALLEEGRAASNDPLANLVKLPAQDRVISGLDLLKYSRNEDDLHKYPNIAAWFPLTAEKVRSLGIDPSKGAGQMRPISRLYFFDNYRQTRDTIAQKLDHLKANRQNRHQLARLNLEVAGEKDEKVRIVVIGSIAGGTGSGSFLDMGWLARLLAYKAFGGDRYDVQLVLFTPRGYAKADRDHTEANGYAALMELETCMRQYPEFICGSDGKGTWLLDEGKLSLDPTPYTDVYLIETANMGRHALEDVKEVYEMVADALFEDFLNADFADKKRSIAVNQQKHKSLPYHPPIPDGYGELKLKYNMGYSSFGQSILDTQHAQQLDEQEYRWCAAMLEAFFCVSGQDKSALRATDQQRDDFIRQHLKLIPVTFDRFPDFGNNKERRDICSPFIDNQLTTDLLKDEHGGIEDAIQQKVNAVIERIKSDEHNITEWARLLREQIPALEQDAIRNQDTTAETSEDRVERWRSHVLEEKKQLLNNRLYNYLDDQDYGGLEFVLTLIDLIKTAFDHPATGLVNLLRSNSERYFNIRDALKTHQIENSLGNVATAVEKKLLKKPDTTKAKTYMDQLKQDIGDYLRFHVRGIAAKNAAILLTELSSYLGSRNGTDDKGNPLYTGLMEEFQSGRREVQAVANEIRKMTKRIEDSSDKRHANYIFLPVADLETVLPGGQQLRIWANEAFKDFEGSRKIFPMLKTPIGKAKLIARLRNKAVAERVNMVATSTGWKDPLVIKLNSIKETRQRVFSDLLRAAMPWIDASFADVPLKAQRFKCLLGVGKVEEWEPFLEELRACLPTYAGITAEQFQLCSTGIPGRAVCYCELSGFPLRVLRALDNWRVSYRQVSKEWPLHTHIDPTLFVNLSCLQRKNSRIAPLISVFSCLP
ncbi:MAG: tubulin-like doman-containing protein [Nitrospirota bacterium]